MTLTAVWVVVLVLRMVQRVKQVELIRIGPAGVVLAGLAMVVAVAVMIIVVVIGDEVFVAQREVV